MMNINIFDTEMFPYMEGEALVGLNITLTISDLKVEKMKSHKGRDEEKYVLYFKENRKGFVLNKTNAKRIAQMYGATTDGWAGKQITLSTEPVQAFGELHNALRVVPGAMTHSNGNDPMTLDKLFVNLNGPKGVPGFYQSALEIHDCRNPSAVLPESDDIEGWRVLFLDAKNYALSETAQVVGAGFEDDQPELFGDAPPTDDAPPGAYETE